MQLFAGSFLTTDYLEEAIRQSTEYRAVDVVALRTALIAIADRFPRESSPNESQTEDDFIWPILAELGWSETLRQQNLSAGGRLDIPDGLLFIDGDAKDRANAQPEEWRRYEHGATVVESKRWAKPLDRAVGREDAVAPSTQMLRYLRRIGDNSEHGLRWGILTNGARWRLYWAGARSVSEEFLEVDLAGALALDARGEFGVGDEARDHALRVFAAIFSRTAFARTGADGRSFHERARAEAAFYEERVAKSLSKLVSDKSSAGFFKEVSQAKQVRYVIDFFNKRYDGTLFFPDVYYRFKFCGYIATGTGRSADEALYGFFIRDVAEVNDPDRVFAMSADEIELINPNSSTAPIFRSRRDKEITSRIYDGTPVLVDYRSGEPVAVWPVRYVRMLDMANDSDKFRTVAELTGDEAAWPIGGNQYQSGSGVWWPLYEGKMVQAYDHRAADIVLAAANVFRPGQGSDLDEQDHADPARQPTPRYWVPAGEAGWNAPSDWCLAIKDVTSVTNMRTTIATMIPKVGAGHTLPVLFPKKDVDATAHASIAPLLLANMNTIAFDYLARQKVHGNHLAWYLLEQLPVISPENYARQLGSKSAIKIVHDAVLELTYTAHDMAPFARDLGYVDTTGEVLPPFAWDEERRFTLRSKLDALYLILYGVWDAENPAKSREDINYIYSTFQVLERDEQKVFGRFRSPELALLWINALMAGQPDADIRD